MADAPRSLAQRLQDTRRRLETEVDAWIATAGDDGPWLVPLSFLWEGETLLISTPAASPTARNLAEGARVRVGIGPTRDVILVEGTAHPVALSEVSPAHGDAFAAKTGFDPRTLRTPYVYIRIRPRRVQAWQEANELAGRDLMRGGAWREPDHSP